MICLHYTMWETSQSMPTSTEGLVGRQSIWRFGCCVTYMWWVREDILPLTLGARQKLQQTWYLDCQGHGHWNWALQLFILWCGATRLQLTFWSYVDTCSITHCGPYQDILNCMWFNNQRIKKGELTCGKQPTILDQ